MKRKMVAVVGCVTGIFLGLGLALLIGAGDRGTGGRFQLHVWTTVPSQSANPEHGAYRIDTETGEVTLIHSNATMQKLGG